jgi:hypothetical protein
MERWFQGHKRLGGFKVKISAPIELLTEKVRKLYGSMLKNIICFLLIAEQQKIICAMSWNVNKGPIKIF